MTSAVILIIGGTVTMALIGYALYLGLQLKGQKLRQEKADKELGVELERNDRDAKIGSNHCQSAYAKESNRD